VMEEPRPRSCCANVEVEEDDGIVSDRAWSWVTFCLPLFERRETSKPTEDEDVIDFTYTLRFSCAAIEMTIAERLLHAASGLLYAVVDHYTLRVAERE
jgi:hypothetical protein